MHHFFSWVTLTNLGEREKFLRIKDATVAPTQANVFYVAVALTQANVLNINFIELSNTCLRWEQWA